MTTTTLTISIDEALASRVTAVAVAQGISVETLVTACLEQQLEVALRHKVLVERIETVDAQLDAIARFIEEAGSGGGLDPIDLFRICRYPKTP